MKWPHFFSFSPGAFHVCISTDIFTPIAVFFSQFPFWRLNAWDIFFWQHGTFHSIISFQVQIPLSVTVFLGTSLEERGSKFYPVLVTCFQRKSIHWLTSNKKSVAIRSETKPCPVTHYVLSERVPLPLTQWKSSHVPTSYSNFLPSRKYFKLLVIVCGVFCLTDESLQINKINRILFQTVNFILFNSFFGTYHSPMRST